MTRWRLTPWSVWFADLEPAEGHEQGGDRLVIVVNSPVGLTVGRRREVVTVVPVTRTRRGWPWQVPTELGGVPGAAMPEQIRTISTARIRRRFDGQLSPEQIDEIRLSIRRLLDLGGY